MKKIKKKSQMEIMGLAVVVILVTLIMLFVVRFIVLKQPAEYKKEFTQTELASNMINTLLKTNVPQCSYLTFTELFQDCAEGETVDCSNDGTADSCSYAQQEVELILRGTLDALAVHYNFKAEKGATSPTQLFSAIEDSFPDTDLNHGCPGEKKSKRYPLPTSGLTIYIILDIC